MAVELTEYEATCVYNFSIPLDSFVKLLCNLMHYVYASDASLAYNIQLILAAHIMDY